MESPDFVRPFALWLALPLLCAVALLMRRGGDARRQFAPVWLFDEPREGGGGGLRFAWRDPVAAAVLAAGLVWIAALAVPTARHIDASSPGLIVLDAGIADAVAPATSGALAVDGARALERALSRARAGGRDVRFYAAGCNPAGPFQDVAQVRAAIPAPDGPTLGELLVELAPRRTQPVEVFSWSAGPASTHEWRAHQLDGRGAGSHRVAMASLDAEGLLAVVVVSGDGQPVRGGSLRVAAPPDSMSLQLDAEGRAAVDLSGWMLRPRVGDAPLAVDLRPEVGASGELSVTAPRACRVWLACEDPLWDEAISAWPGFRVLHVDRARLPSTADGWGAWRAARGPAGGRELFVAVGASPPSLPDAMPWLWIAPRPSRGAGLEFTAALSAGAPQAVGPDAAQAQDALWEGLDLSGCPQSARWEGPRAEWRTAAGGRVMLGAQAAVLNLASPASPHGTSEPALVALRLARRLAAAPPAFAGPGLPSGAWEWPMASDPGDRVGAGTAAARATARTARVLVVLATLISLAALLIARMPWHLRSAVALALAALAVFALRTPGRQLVLVLDASQSCRASVPAAAARAYVGLPAADRRLSPWIAALDGEGGRWLATPAAPDLPPRDEQDFAAWLRARLAALPRTSRSRLAPALRQLESATALGDAHSVVVSDGRFAEPPTALAAALPAGPVTVVEASAGHDADAAIVSLQLVGEGADQAAEVVADDGGHAATVTLELDGQPVAQQRLQPATVDARADTTLSPPRGLHRVRMALPPRGVGAHRVAARIVPTGPVKDPGIDENDVLVLMRDDTVPTVRWIRGASGGLPTDDRRDARFVDSTTGEAVAPDVWVLDAVPESMVAQVEPLLLASLDRGVGLVVLAGPGGWLATGRSGERALEARLPIRLRVSDERDPAPPPWMVLLDASGSMATVEAGVSQFERALLALSAALASARPEEAVGVLAFAERVLATVPPHTRLTRDEVQTALHGVHPSGGTRLLSALQQAADALRALGTPRAVDASPRLVVLSDGMTGREDLAQWKAAVAGCRVIVLEFGGQGTPALRDLAAATGGHHRLLRSLEDLAAALGEEAVSPPRERVVATPDSVHVDDPRWGPLAPTRVDAHLALTKASGQFPWTVGRLRDPLLALGESGTARVAVLATTPGPPWGGSTPWEGTLAALLAWAGRRDEPEATWSTTGQPRLYVDPRAVEWASGTPDRSCRLALVDSAGDTTALAAVAPGIYRALGARPLTGGMVIDVASGERVAHLPAEDPAAELRTRGVDRVRLAELRAAASARPHAVRGGAAGLPRALPILLAAAFWIGVVGMLALAANRLSSEAGPGGTPGR